MAQQAAFKETSYGGDVFTTNMSVGEILRRSRLHYNQTLHDIERELHIKPPQIEAMESDRFDLLPGRVYAIGFVRAYSEYLGLDGNKMVTLFKQQSHGKNAGPALNFPVCPSESKVPSMWLVAGSLAVLVLGAIGWGAYSFSGSSVDVREIPPVPENLKNLDQNQTTFNQPQIVDQANFMGPPAPNSAQLNGLAPAAGAVAFGPPSPDQAQPGVEEAPPAAEIEVTAAPPEETPAPVAEAPKGMLLKVVGNSWVEIKDGDGQTLVSRVLKAGEKYFIPNRPNLKLSAGNAAGLSFEIDGQPLNPIGKEGEIIRDLQLDLNYLKTQYATTETSVN